MNSNIYIAWRILYYTYGLFPIVVGIDKFCNKLTHWPKFINPSIPQLVGMNIQSFMYVLGVGEIATGLLVLTYPLMGGYAIMALLSLVIINLISLGICVSAQSKIATEYDTALRALAMLMGAWVFVLLTKVLC